MPKHTIITDTNSILRLYYLDGISSLYEAAIPSTYLAGNPSTHVAGIQSTNLAAIPNSYFADIPSTNADLLIFPIMYNTLQLHLGPRNWCANYLSQEKMYTRWKKK